MNDSLTLLGKEHFLDILELMINFRLPSPLAEHSEFLSQLGLPGHLEDDFLWETDAYTGAFLVDDRHDRDTDEAKQTASPINIVHVSVSTSYGSSSSPASVEDTHSLFNLFAEQVAWVAERLGQPSRRTSGNPPAVAWNLETGCELELRITRGVEFELNSPRTVRVRDTPGVTQEEITVL